MDDILGFIWEILVVTILFKLIILKSVADVIKNYLKGQFSQSERNHAILQHFLERAKGNGHKADSVLNCYQDNCRVFG